MATFIIQPLSIAHSHSSLSISQHLRHPAKTCHKSLIVLHVRLVILLWHDGVQVQHKVAYQSAACLLFFFVLFCFCFFGKSMVQLHWFTGMTGA